MKIKIFAILILSFLITLSSLAQNSSLLWKIEGNGLKQTSYLFGTIHVIPKKDFFFTKKMEKALKTCDNLVLEVDMTKMSFQEKLQMSMQSFLPNQKTIEDYISADEFNTLRSFIVDSLKIKEKKFEKYIRFQPFFMSSLILVDKLGKVKMYEEEISAKAKKNKMTVFGLEEIQDQLDIVKSYSIEKQVDLFLDTDTHGYDLMKEFYELLEMYKNQDIDAMYEYMQASSEGNFEQKFLIDRNAKWIPIIEKRIEDKASFIAVGAGHLSGDKGIIALLRAQGYTVTAVE